VQGGDGLHEFHDEHGLADTGAPEQAGFAALDERTEQVDDLDAGFEHLPDTDRLAERRRARVDIPENVVRQRIAAVQRLAKEIQQTPEAVRRHRHVQRGTGIVDRHAAAQAGGSVQSDGAHVLFIKVLMHLEQIGFVIEIGVQRLAQDRQRTAGDNDHRAVYFGYGAGLWCRREGIPAVSMLFPPPLFLFSRFRCADAGTPVMSRSMRRCGAAL